MLMLAMLMLFGAHLASAATCATYNHTGVDYADPNVTVVSGVTTSADCCDECVKYNAMRTPGEANCTVSVWLRDFSLCTLKASANLPVVANHVASTQPVAPPDSTFRFANTQSDNMVLSASPLVAQVWGFTVPGDQVTVEFQNQKIQANISAEDGVTLWKAALPATPASFQEHEVMARSAQTSKTITLSGVLFGDVWVCSGQSNMAYALSGSNGKITKHPPVNDSEREIAEMANYPHIRLYRPEQRTSHSPQLEELTLGAVSETGPDAWSQPCPGGVCRVNFSAVCWMFGRDIYHRVQRPIGLIGSYVGGTPDEAWSSPDALMQCSDPESPLQGSKLWNGMIYPLLRSTVKGVAWYQGENDWSHPGGQYGGYNCTFPAMIEDWRSKWHHHTGGLTEADFPFGFVQLNTKESGPTYNNPTDTLADPFSNQSGFAGLRWAQTAGFGYVPNPKMPRTFMAVSLDTPYGGNVHSIYKAPVAARLARAGLKEAYGIDVGTVGPRAEVGRRIGDQLTINLTGLGKGSVELHNSTAGFEVLSGTTWVNTPIVAHSSNSITLGKVPSDATRLRYLWYANPCGNTDSFQCLVYVSAEPMSNLSGEHPFLPLGPLFEELQPSSSELVV